MYKKSKKRLQRAIHVTETLTGWDKGIISYLLDKPEGGIYRTIKKLERKGRN